MHGNTIMMEARRRERVGSRYARRARDGGRLPAIVYGHGAAPVPVTVDAKLALTHIHKGEKVFTLSIEGESAQQMVLLKGLQFDYLGTNIVHADFARVDLDERIHTRVHVSLVGEAKGLKTAGAILMHPTSELDIECTVTEIPDSIEVDISNLDVDTTITAAQVKLPKDSMRLLTDSHAIVAQIVIQKAIEEATEAAAVGATPTQPEVITAKKPEEGDKAAPAKGGEKKEEKKK